MKGDIAYIKVVSLFFNLILRLIKRFNPLLTQN